MNNLQFHEGGQPLHLDDLSFMQSSFLMPLEHIARSLGDCYLGGAEILVDKDTNAHRWTDGAIAYDGGIYAVDAGVIEQVDLSNTLYWIFERSYDGYKTLENGSEEATQEVCKARLVQARDVPSQPHTEAYLLPRLGVDIARKPWRKFSFTGENIRVVDFKELSLYSGVLTLMIQGALPTKGEVGTFKLTNVTNMYGKTVVHSGEVASDEKFSLELVNGRLLISKEGESLMTNRRLQGSLFVTMFIAWDFLTSSGTERATDDLSSAERSSLENDRRFSGGTSSGAYRTGDRR